MDRLVYEAATSGDVGLFRRIKDGDELPDVLYKKTPKDNNVLHIAAEFKQIKFFNDIPLEYGSSLFWATNKKGDTPLHVAAKVGCVEVVEFLIEHARKTLHHMERGDEESGPADGESQNKLLRVKNSNNDTTLHLAVRYNHDEVVIRLMEADPQLCCFTNNANESPLFLAVRKGTPSIVHCILKAYEAGISPSFQGTNGVTALHAAVTQEQLKDKGVIEIMVSKNRDLIKEVDAIGWTPLHYAAFTGNVEAAQLLMKSDSSASYILDLSKMSALHVAAYAGHTKVMEELILYQPDACDLLNSKGQTALHSAVLGGQRDVVAYILKTPKLSGLINEVDEEGNTPLHIGVIYKKFEVITILVADVRVDTTAVNKKMSKAIDIFLGQNIKEQEIIDSPFLQHLGSSVGGPFFQQKISDDFNRLEPSEKDTPGTPAIEHTKRQNLQATSNQALKRLDTNLVVTTLIATVTFAAALTPPGGFKSDGTPVLLDNSFFKVFQFFNQLSFLLAILAIYNESAPIRFFSIEIATPAVLIRYSIGGLLAAFISGGSAMVPKSQITVSFKDPHSKHPSLLDAFLRLVFTLVMVLVVIPVFMTMIGTLTEKYRARSKPRPRNLKAFMIRLFCFFLISLTVFIIACLILR